MRYTRILLTGICLAGLTTASTASDTFTAPVPILVELFTSEGCSDCPPADAFLQKLDQQPFAGTEMIVLSEHVDYWNHDGWKDPYSHSLTERQAEYASAFALRSVYTPQMVVDGTTEFVGSNQAAAGKAFANAAIAPKIDLRLSSIAMDSSDLRVHVETGTLPKNSKGDVYIAVALNHAESQVSAGENAGRTISHTAVVRIMDKAGSIQKGEAFAKDVQVKLPSNLPTNDLRLVAFVQQPHQGRVLAAAMQLLNGK